MDEREINPCLLRCVDLSRELPVPAKAPVDAVPRPLLTGVHFGLPQGDVLTVLGPSGAGKTTLLRLLNRLDEPSGGAVLLNGEDYRTLPPRELRRKVGMVMQRAYLFPGTVAENVAYGPRQQGKTLPPFKVENMLEQVGLGGYGGRSVATLSGGEAQRVAITRALANEPEVLLLDEPTSALDEAARDGVERLLESLIRQRNLTCVWVTHDEAQARRVGNSVLRLEAGRVAEYGPVERPPDAANLAVTRPEAVSHG